MAVISMPYSTNAYAVNLVSTTTESGTKTSLVTHSIAPGSQKVKSVASNDNVFALAQAVAPLYAGSFQNARRVETTELTNG